MTIFLDTVRCAIERYGMVRPGDRILVGVSGGPDSVALLTALVALRQEKRLTLFAAYVDHGARPAAARQEAAFVKKLGKLWGIPVTVLKRTVRKQGGESWEAVARKVRYEALMTVARRLRCGAIALGHTQDDQAETILMWVLRGTGTSGLTGIPPVRDVNGSSKERVIRIIRPLIACSRKEVEAFLKSHGLRPLHDKSNDSARYLRNRIRHELIPFLERRYNPQVKRHLAQLADVLREDLAWLGQETASLFRQAVRARNGSVRLNCDALQAVPTAVRRGTLKLAIERLQGDRHGFSSGHWMALDEMIIQGAPRFLDLPHGVRAEILQERGSLTLSRAN